MHFCVMVCVCGNMYGVDSWQGNEADASDPDDDDAVTASDHDARLINIQKVQKAAADGMQTKIKQTRGKQAQGCSAKAGRRGRCCSGPDPTFETEGGSGSSSCWQLSQEQQQRWQISWLAGMKMWPARSIPWSMKMTLVLQRQQHVLK